MSWNENPYRYIKKQNDKRNTDILQIIDQYRLLTGMTWREFIFACMAFYIRQENPDVADAIGEYIRNTPPPGRPKGNSVKVKLNEMGVNPKTVQKPYI
jgi:hypothetical protein